MAYFFFLNPILIVLAVIVGSQLGVYIALLWLPSPFLFYKYGTKIRAQSKFAPCIVSGLDSHPSCISTYCFSEIGSSNSSRASGQESGRCQTLKYVFIYPNRDASRCCGFIAKDSEAS